MSGDGRRVAERDQRDGRGGVARLMVTVLRTVDDVLEWAGRLVDPPLRAAVGRLPEPSRDIAELQLGWLDGSDAHPRRRAGALRPTLALVCADAAGGDPHAAVPGAVAVELVHHWSLIQRDLLDGEVTQRHRPTAWSVVGPHPATLGGEALLALSFEVAATGDPNRARPGAAVDRTAVRLLGGTVQQLLQGQHTALALTGSADHPGRAGSAVLRDCIAAVERRTGALFGCACALGALAGGADPAQVEQFRLFGVRLGLAVQFAEDLAGIWGDPAVTGRPSYPDLRRRRRSLPIAAALVAGADELTEVLDRPGRLSDADLERAAKAIEQSGARAWCRQQADDLLAQALLAVDLAVPSPAAVAELVALARWATREPA